MVKERRNKVKVLTYEKRMLTDVLALEKSLRQKVVEDAQAASKRCDASFR